MLKKNVGGDQLGERGELVGFRLSCFVCKTKAQVLLSFESAWPKWARYSLGKTSGKRMLR